MSEKQPAHNSIADEVFEAQKSVDMQALSMGHITPEAFEQQWVPEIESSFNNANFSQFSQDLQEEVAHNTSLAYELRHKPTSELIESLYKAGVISYQMVISGLLETRFAPNRPRTPNSPYQVGGLMHILLGDVAGGLHDVDTLHDAGLAGEGQDTKVVGLSDKYEGRPDIRYGLPVDEDGDGDIDRVDLKVAKGKTQFPEEWTTDEVLLAIIMVSENPPEPKDVDKPNANNTHNGVINGINIVVKTDADGKIITAYPEKQAVAYKLDKAVA